MLDRKRSEKDIGAMTKEIRAMEARDRREVADLICVSTNYWYEAHGLGRIFADGPESADIFYQVYDALAGSAGLVAEVDGRLAGSCFYHERPTHVALGIMNAHPNFFGHGIARSLLRHIVDIAERSAKPLRLVSSALNIDSFSLYTRAGFVPRRIYQDVVIEVPEEGWAQGWMPTVDTRPARVEDAALMALLERKISGVDRGGDYRHFIENAEGFWRVCACENDAGELTGFLVAGRDMLGPGVAESEAQAAALVHEQLRHRRGRATVFLVPAECASLVRQVYDWGGRNCELHFAQVRGACAPFAGVTMPSFMPETG